MLRGAAEANASSTGYRCRRLRTSSTVEVAETTISSQKGATTPTSSRVRLDTRSRYRARSQKATSMLTFSMSTLIICCEPSRSRTRNRERRSSRKSAPTKIRLTIRTVCRRRNSVRAKGLRQTLAAAEATCERNCRTNSQLRSMRSLARGATVAKDCRRRSRNQTIQTAL